MLRQPAVIVICPDLFSTMTISLVLFSARHCLFPARFRLAYYHALLYSISLSLCPFSLAYPPVLLLTVFRRILPLFFPSFSFFSFSFFPFFSPSLTFPTIANSTLARFLAPVWSLLPEPRAVCLRRASVRPPTAWRCPSVDGYRLQFSSVFDVPRPAFLSMTIARQSGLSPLLFPAPRCLGRSLRRIRPRPFAGSTTARHDVTAPERNSCCRERILDNARCN